MKKKKTKSQIPAVNLPNLDAVHPACPLAPHFEQCPDFGKTCDAILCEFRKKFRRSASR